MTRKGFLAEDITYINNARIGRHDWGKALANHEWCFEIDAKNFVPLLGRRVAKRGARENGRVVNNQVQLVIFCRNVLNELCNIRLLSKIRLKEPD